MWLVFPLVFCVAADAAPLFVYDARPSLTASPALAYEVPHLLASISGLVNRKLNSSLPAFFYLWGHSDEAWLTTLRAPGQWLADRNVTTLPNLESVVTTFGQTYNYFPKGAVLYDPMVPATSLVASTAAGFEDLLPICFRPDENGESSLYARLVAGGPALPVGLNLVGMFNGSHTGSSKCDALTWAKERYLDTYTGTEPVPLAYYLDYYWVTEAERGIIREGTQAEAAGKESITPLSFAAHTAPTSNGDPAYLNTVGNHDYFISHHGFFFDLSPWDDETPNDDPAQPLGTDANTMQSIFLSAYTANANAKRRREGKPADSERQEAGPADGGAMIHLGGFPPWKFKYVKPFGKHDGVPTEWHFALIASGYNIYMDADACCVHDFANSALYQHYPLKANYPQNPAPSLADLKALGYVSATGAVVPKQYFMFYVGDYDSASWLYNQMPALWADSNRGKVPLGWAFDPNLSDRFPPIFDLTMSTLSSNDRVIAGDSGAGYVNPDQLLEPRQFSKLPSGEKAWQSHNEPLFRKFDINFTGFLINGDAGQLTEAALDMYAPFSFGGVVAQTGTLHVTGKTRVPVLVHDSDLPGGDVAGAVKIVVDTSAGAKMGFHVFRTVLQSPTYHLQVAQGATAQNDRITVVDPLVLAALLRRTHEDRYGTLYGGAAFAPLAGISSNSAELILQDDGNLVLYSQATRAALWTSGTAGKCVDASSRFTLQATDGNLVLYGCGDEVLWESETEGKGGVVLALQPDCNLVLYQDDEHRTGVVWQTATHC